MRLRLLKPATMALLLAAGAAATHASTARFWRVSTRADLLKGEATGLSIDYDGRLVPGPASRTLLEPAAAFIWCLAPAPGGAVYAGSGNDGLVWRIDRDGSSRVVFDAAELEVHALAVSPDGSLFVGTSPDGRVYRIGADGAATPFFDPDDTYIWALALDPAGRLYVATGGKGAIYRVGRDGRSEMVFRAQAANVTSLAVDAAGRVFAGTESPGRVVRISADGKAFVLLDSPYRELRGLRVDAEGTLYAVAVDGKPEAREAAQASPPAEPPRAVPAAAVSTEISAVTIVDASASASGAAAQAVAGAPPAKGAVYRIDASGASEIVWSFPDDQPYDLVPEDGGSLLVATGGAGRIYRLAGDPWKAMLVTRVDSRQATSLLRAEAATYVAASNPARVVRIERALAAEGSYVSEAKDAGMTASWGTIAWRASGAGPGAIRIATRTGNTAVPDDTWSDWSAPYHQPEGDVVTSPAARYLQWRAELKGQPAGPASPALTSVSIAYLQRNARPRVTEITVHPPGIVFQRPYPAGEPDIAGLGDVPGEARAPAFATPLGSAQQTPASGPALGRRMYQKGLQAFAWKAEDDNDDRMEYTVFFRAAGDAQWKTLRANAPDLLVTWDTTSVPDGTYVVKVRASDAPNNPAAQALSGELESAAFDVDNGAPAITIVRAIQGASASEVVFEVADSHSPLSAVEYSIDSGRWIAAYPVDGAADSRRERYEIRIEGKAEGRLVIRATDGMNNTATASVGGTDRR